MWADQVSADDELVDRSSFQKEAASGYNISEIEMKPEEVEPPRPETVTVEVASPEPQNPFADPIDLTDDFIPTESPQPQAVDLLGDTEAGAQQKQEAPRSYAAAAAEPPTSDSAPVGFPTDIPPPAAAAPGPAPVSFPSSSSQPEIATSPAVTFGAEVGSPPSRSGTPDIDGKPKRVRKTSQNIQKFARSLTLATRRQSSGSSAVKQESSPRTSREDSSATRGEGSVGGDSTEASIAGDDKKEGKGKGKKGKKSKSSK